jgi:SAM-dependent methyltransferase
MPIPTSLTNPLRRLLDERLPRRLRNARWFMAPLFFVWCKGRHVRTWMDFKRLALAMTATQLRAFYRAAVSFASERASDTNPEALAHVLGTLDPAAVSLVDVGSGRGHFLRTLQGDRRFAPMRLAGCDLADRPPAAGVLYAVADAELLPFADGAFDVATCFHTVEHLLHPGRAVAELRRIARRQLVIVVPRQAYFFYTMDLHLNFFPEPADLARLLGVPPDRICQFGSDLVYVEDRTLTRGTGSR